MTESRKKPGVAFWLIVVATASLLYVVSSGPAIWMFCKGYLSERAFEVVYLPLTWIQERAPKSVQDVCGGWLSFWAPDDWEEEFNKELGQAIAKGILNKMAEDLVTESRDEATRRTFKLRRSEGTLVVTVSDPDAEVKVLDTEGTVTIKRFGETVPITFSVDPITHQLKCCETNSETFASTFVIEPGSSRAITAKLVPPEYADEEK
jgi:hypothetical protein